MAEVFRGFKSPNTTPVPDELIDEVMHILSGSELKVLLYIVRRTYGFKKTSDDICLDQICGGIVKKNGDRLDHGTGLSRETAVKAIRGLRAKGIIVQKKNGPAPATYFLHFDGDEAPPIPAFRKKSEKTTSIHQPAEEDGKKSDLSVEEVGKADLKEVRESDSQETVLQETVLQELRTTTTSMTLDVSMGNPVVVVPEPGSGDRSLQDPPDSPQSNGRPPEVEPSPAVEEWEAEAVELREWLYTCKVSPPVNVGALHVMELIVKVIQRPTWIDEVEDILDYAELSQTNTDARKRLGGAWVVSELQNLVARSPNSRRAFRWMAGKNDNGQLQNIVDQMDEIKRRYGGYELAARGNA